MCGKNFSIQNHHKFHIKFTEFHQQTLFQCGKTIASRLITRKSKRKCQFFSIEKRLTLLRSSSSAETQLALDGLFSSDITRYYFNFFNYLSLINHLIPCILAYIITETKRGSRLMAEFSPFLKLLMSFVWRRCR